MDPVSDQLADDHDGYLAAGLQGELAQLMVERQAMYQFLARPYREEVDRDLLNELAQFDIPADTGVPGIDQGFQLLARYLGAVNETTLSDLAADYTRIFLGAGPNESGNAFPYESVYTSPRGLLMQEARDQVVELYRQEGLQRSADLRDPEDHLALELEFVALLCQKTAKALQAQDRGATAHCLSAQNHFLEKHLLPWVPRLCTDIVRIAATDFYKAIAAITASYLAIDQNLVADLLVVQEPPSRADERPS
jgi:putative dimethyl sulfoxide reductase chaperone